MNEARRSPKSTVHCPKSLVCLVCVCIVLVLPGCFKLDSFLFDPSTVTEYLRMTSADSAAWHVRGIIPDSLREPVTLTTIDSDTFYGFFVRQPADTDGAAPAGTTVIYNHGNGQNINRYWGRVELLWEAGCNVFIYDYAGYGKSPGSPSGEACYLDAEAALDYVLGRPDVVDSNVVYLGWSLGSFMACHLAADVRTPRCLILENPMASTSALAKEGAVLGIPGSFLVNADFDNELRMQLLPTDLRTLIIYGKKDDTAVPERNALVLLDKAYRRTLATGWPVENAGHSDLPEVMGYDEYERVISAFIAGDSL